MIERPVHISRIVDHGSVVSLLGQYDDDGSPARITLDHRPFIAFWQDWAKAGHPQPVLHDADEATLRFE